MEDLIDFYVPTREEFLKGCEVYNHRETRGADYFCAIEIISDNWGYPVRMAAGVATLISSWNPRYSNFNLDELADCLELNMSILENYRNKDILIFSNSEADCIKKLFNEFLEALKRRGDGKKSPVSVAKALNPLVPTFLPLWDSSISEAYHCGYSGYGSENAASIYLKFCEKMKLMAEQVKDYVSKPDDRSLLKRIDEYSYSKYTKAWV